MTVQAWITEAKERLRAAGIEAFALEAQVLAAHVLLVDRSWLFAHPEEPFPELAGESLLLRRIGQEPLAYIVGRREFYGRQFSVNPSVLIPRQDTEILVQAALDLNPKTVLDLGTGSGCIATTLKLEKPGMDVTASDVSQSALDTAAQNAADLGADVRFVRSDGFQALSGRRFDLIVSNPPYIGSDEVLAPEVDRFEPHAALYSGPTGLEFYERIAREAPDYLTTQESVAMEVGYRQSRQVVELFERLGWIHHETRLDLSGIERVVVVGRQPSPERT